MDAHDPHAPKKNSTLNTIGIITVGVVGSVFVYVSIIALQALYVSETSPMAIQKTFGHQGQTKDSLRSEQIGNIVLGPEARTKSVYGPSNTQLYAIDISAGKQLIIRDAVDPSRFVPAIAPSVTPNIAPVFGRPQPLAVAPPPAPPPVDPTTGGPADPTAPPPTDPGGQPGPATPGAAGGGPAGPPVTGAPPTGATSPAASGPPATTPPALAPAAGATPPAPPAGETR